MCYCWWYWSSRSIIHTNGLLSAAGTQPKARELCAFTAQGDGLLVGEGSVFFVCKTLAAAERDGDSIHAVIHGIGVSNDRDCGLFAPAQEGQERAIRAAYAQAGWSPRDIDYVECHGTGTPTGDRVELSSLERGMERGRC